MTAGEVLLFGMGDITTHPIMIDQKINEVRFASLALFTKKQKTKTS
jgi:hypothetical protein